jgi:glycosyltransferase involved in cell wall biosynthesis
MGKNGHELVKNNYSWESIAEKVEQLYDWLTGKCEKPEFVYM